MFKKILVANRGEIALRIQRACRELGIKAVMVYSEADKEAKYVKLAEEAVCIGPASSALSYLNMPAIISAAEVTDAEAIHPGYGFLSENADFAERVEKSGFQFIGPSPESIRIMGDKVSAKQTMIRAGVPCVPGSEGELPDDPVQIRRIAKSVGYPVIIKAAGGGGGRGMRVVHTEAALINAVQMTKAEAGAAFGNPAVYMEKFLQNPRHVEIQIMADKHRNAVYLGERDCSMQRRHQKVIEESCAPGMRPEVTAAMAEAALRLCRTNQYSGAGTVEFLVDAESQEFYFLEMNTRIQVEHPVTEMVTGVDLVAAQIRHALGDAQLADELSPSRMRLSGHAIEARVYAENPAKNFLPSPGCLSLLELPQLDGVRVECGFRQGNTVSSFYDPMLMKVIAHGDTRESATSKLDKALGSLRIEGVANNVSYLRACLRHPDFIAGKVYTGFLGHRHSELIASAAQPAMEPL